MLGGCGEGWPNGNPANQRELNGFEREPGTRWADWRPIFLAIQ
jgi:hypothetical protein